MLLIRLMCVPLARRKLKIDPKAPLLRESPGTEPAFKNLAMLEFIKYNFFFFFLYFGF